MTDSTDQLARDTSARALSAIETHEKVCTERQGHILENLHDLKRGVEGLYRRFWAAAIGIIALLISLTGALGYLVLTHH